jgi:hypothetical protein
MRRVSVSYADELRPMDTGPEPVAPEPAGVTALSPDPVGSVA